MLSGCSLFFFLVYFSSPTRAILSMASQGPELQRMARTVSTQSSVTLVYFSKT